MTPEVCFEFCRQRIGMQFFFLKNGRDCSCARFYAKGMKKGLGGCTATCEGDGSKYCGSLGNSETVYEMHDCRAAQYVQIDCRTTHF